MKLYYVRTRQGRKYSYDELSETDQGNLIAPFTAEEIKLKLYKTNNTAPGLDKIEYNTIKKADPTCLVVEALFNKLLELDYVPCSWLHSKTIFIHKKGKSPEHLSNFRPISLLSCLYKLFSGILGNRLCSTAYKYGWISKEQKGFIPGVNGTAENIFLLQSAIEHAREHSKDLHVAWIDLENAFGSIHHNLLRMLFNKLPIPDSLRSIFNQIYHNNTSDFLISKNSQPFKIKLNCGVRQGDGLSAVIFNLFFEPVIRLVKSMMDEGAQVYGTQTSVSAYADDLVALFNSESAMSRGLKMLNECCVSLGLKVNVAKSATFSLLNGHQSNTVFSINEEQLRSLGANEYECYLGIPVGRFQTFEIDMSTFDTKMDKIRDSLLAPWQKIEALRRFLIPTLTYELSSGRVGKQRLVDADMKIRQFIQSISNLPATSCLPFYYADRNIGGLAVPSLAEDCDIYAVNSGLQLLTSSDSSIARISFCQLENQLKKVLRSAVSESNNAPLPINQFLSGDQTDGLYSARFAKNDVQTIWSRMRKSSKRLGLKIDFAGPNETSVQMDSVKSKPKKLVRSLHLAARLRANNRLFDCTKQGLVARGLALSKQKFIAKGASVNSYLSFREWRYIHRARLGLLPVRTAHGYVGTSDKCRRCGIEAETQSHVLNWCVSNKPLIIERHNNIVHNLAKTLREADYAVEIESSPADSNLRPDITVVKESGERIMIDVVVAYDSPENLKQAYARKIGKYGQYGLVLPLVVGSLGSWYPENDDIKREFHLPAAKWNRFLNDSIATLIESSVSIVHQHLNELFPVT